MIDRDYAHHIQFAADWSIEDEQSEGVHTVDVYDADLNTLFAVFIRFITAEYNMPEEVIRLKLAEYLEE